MIQDATELPAGTVIETDLCIIGGGPAGIVLARHFFDTQVSVCLLESGAFEIDPKVQALSNCKTDGNYPNPGLNLVSYRERRLGGSSNHWGGWCRPFDPIDFQKRDWVPESGWPITRETLNPYYKVAAELCEVPGFTRAEEDTEEGVGQHFNPLIFGRNGKIVSRLIHTGPGTEFGYIYRDELLRSKNVRVLLNSTMDLMVPDRAGKRLESVSVKTLAGNGYKVKAKRYVLATGGVENPRLLLLSNTVIPGGIGNHSGRVGRCFMQHPELVVGHLHVKADRSDVFDLYKEEVFNEKLNSETLGLLCPTAKAQRDAKTMNFALQLNRIEQGKETAADVESIQAYKALELLQSSGEYAYRERAFKESYAFSLVARVEQSPDLDNRIVLDPERDVLGMNKAKVIWKFTKFDQESVVKSLRIFACEAGAINQGRLSLARADPKDFEYLLWGHFMGTTRMGESPADSVVDPNCSVHGMSNLYVAGASVFPTSGFANPTMTIVALALRLADHLEQELHR